MLRPSPACTLVVSPCVTAVIVGLVLLASGAGVPSGLMLAVVGALSVSACARGLEAQGGSGDDCGGT